MKCSPYIIVDKTVQLTNVCKYCANWFNIIRLAVNAVEALLIATLMSKLHYFDSLWISSVFYRTACSVQ